MDAVIGGSPLSVFKGRDRQTEFELQGVFGMKVPTTVAAHDLELTIDRFDDIGCGKRLPHVLGVLQESQIVHAFLA